MKTVVRFLGLLLALSASMSAHAAMHPDQGAAYAACARDIATGPSYWQPMRCNGSVDKDGSGWYDAWDRNGRSVGWGLYSWGKGTSCSNRPEETSWRGPGVGSVGSVCSDGCAYDGSVYAGSPIGLLFTPNGQTCTESDHPKPTTPDPGEGDGGGDGGGTDPGGGDGGGSDPGGGDGGGTDPGGGDGGGTGPGDGDGECKDPDGCDGTGPGPGPGPGTGEGEGGDGGAPGPTTGRLYKKSGKTVQKVLADFKTAIEGAPILSKVKGFFGSCTGGGSCPTATWDGGQYAGKFDLGALCSGPLLQLFQYAGFVFLAGMGIVALRWALL